MSFHEHVHDHHHDGEDTYYIDQLCMVAICGAFGAVCLTLYFWQTKMLELLLGPQFHIYILLSGAILLVLAVLRGAALWVQAGAVSHAGHHHHHHDQQHNDQHDHDHHEHSAGEVCN